MLIQLAYIIAPHVPMKVSVPELDRAPAWIDSARYQIRAKAAVPASQEIMRGPMLQALLEERFKLKIHGETREIPVYALTVAKGGLKLQPTGDRSCTEPDNILRFQGPLIRMGCSKLQRREGSRTPWDRSQPKPPPTDPGQKPWCGRLRGVGGSSGGMVDILGTTMAEIAGVLGASGRHVIDKTRITGDFDFHLEYAVAEAEPSNDPGLPSIFTALGRLGLKLELAKGPGEFLVVDHVERPSEN
jgi:uncharacterized protein (TIGR03435 family)